MTRLTKTPSPGATSIAGPALTASNAVACSVSVVGLSMRAKYVVFAPSAPMLVVATR